MRRQPSMARCIEARSVRSPSTTSAPSRRRASARSSSRRTKARTLCPLASKNSVRLRPMAPTAPAAPVTRIGLSCLCSVVTRAAAPPRPQTAHRIGLSQRSERGPMSSLGHTRTFWRKANIMCGVRDVRQVPIADVRQFIRLPRAELADFILPRRSQFPPARRRRPPL